MLSRETLEQYRRMTVSERLALTFKLTEDAEPWLLRGSPDVVKRRFELLRRQNNERNKRILKGLARARRDA